MKKTLIAVTVLVTLLTASSVLAGDIDGLWWNPDMGMNGVVMVRENGSTVIAVELSLLQFGEPYDYCALSGTQMGNTINLQDISSYCGVDINATMTLTSPTTAMVKVNYCHPTFAYSCVFPSGVSFNIEKAF